MTLETRHQSLRRLISLVVRVLEDANDVQGRSVAETLRTILDMDAEAGEREMDRRAADQEGQQDPAGDA